MILRARIVLPLCSPPIRDGAVVVRGRRIAAVGRWRDLARAYSASPKTDLGEAILLPGLVNAHCHLDYTQMAGHFPPPKSFTDWLKLITEAKSGWNLSDYRQSWLEGANMLLRSGTTLVGDIEAVPELLPELWNQTPLRIISFLEMIGITARRPPEKVLTEALATARKLRHSRSRPGLSPHAPYSTVAELLKLSGREARRRRWPLCTHVAESAVEFEMFAHARGEMFEWIKRSGRDMSDCGHGSPVRHLRNSGVLGRNLLAIHANYLAPGDAPLLAREQVSVVHCPRSHHYFRHQPFPLKRLLRAGVNVCLGTDSLASVVLARRQPADLSLLEEMRALAHREPWLGARRVLEMATLNGAQALGFNGRAGQLSPGAFADLIVVRGAGDTPHPEEQVISSRRVAASMIDGTWQIAPDGACD